MAEHITPELLRQVLRYEPETGKLFWLPRPREMFKSGRDHNAWNTLYAGDEALKARSETGYFHGVIFHKKRLAHRIVWMINNGNIPEGMQIDHVDGDKKNNVLSNLRLATKSQNMANSGPRSDNTSGVRGVCWRKDIQKWKVEVRMEGVRKNVGVFKDLEMAKAAQIAAAEAMHGEFAYHNRKNVK